MQYYCDPRVHTNILFRQDTGNPKITGFSYDGIKWAAVERTIEYYGCVPLTIEHLLDYFYNFSVEGLLPVLQYLSRD